ncbi:MAG TPA: hypothetical protein VJK30_04305 [Coxiellaceae bacterium]|nr:MAG: hypothetical protein A3E81_07680 [Gammaproteobacteria bacterium RIFCSPHIGHO2_12_FULL_36_30]HLB56532.1 hypothetical protein [Coxiellaceae bacterium]
MFTWLNKQGVKSDKGFIVQSVARFVIEYREANKCISIEVESDYAPGMKPIEKISMNILSKWDDGTPITEETQKEILKNFTEAMEFQGIGVIVE